MPIREYKAIEAKKACRHCINSFEEMEAMDAPARKICPRCGEKVERQLSAPNVASSSSGLHDRAKNSGFTTYEKLGEGEYEKKY